MLVFTGSNNLAALNDFPSAFSFTGIIFAANASAFVLSGNSITLGGNIISNSTNTETVNLALILSGNRTFLANTNSGGGDLTFGANAVISGNFSIHINGTSAGNLIGSNNTVTLNAASTYSGGTIIDGGILAISDPANIGASTSNVTINDATLRFNASFTTDRPTILNNANSTIDVNGSNLVTLSSPFTGPGGLTKGAGGGTLVLAPVGKASIPLPNLTINGGALNIGNATGTTAALAVTGTITINNGGVLRLISDPSSTTLGTTLRLDHTANALVLNGTGTLDVGGHNFIINRGNLASTDPASVLQTVYRQVINAYHSPNPGFADGTWNSPGITSALVRADIALAPGNRAGLAIGVWDGTDIQLQTGQPTNTVLIAATVLGDANGDLFTDNRDFDIWRRVWEPAIIGAKATSTTISSWTIPTLASGATTPAAAPTLPKAPPPPSSPRPPRRMRVRHSITLFTKPGASLCSPR